MTDQERGVQPDRCPWCSSDKGADAEGRCLSCGAALLADTVSEPVPGVTDVDALGILRTRGTGQPNRIVAWMTGTGSGNEALTPAGQALEKPSPEVQREMLRLEFDAAIAAQQAEIEAMKAEEALAAADRAARAAVPAPTSAETAAATAVDSPETEAGDEPVDSVEPLAPADPSTDAAAD